MANGPGRLSAYQAKAGGRRGPPMLVYLVPSSTVMQFVSQANDPLALVNNVQ